jgi:hypothetical protein
VPGVVLGGTLTGVAPIPGPFPGVPPVVEGFGETVFGETVFGETVFGGTVLGGMVLGGTFTG